jgi:hypothetical protein
VRLRASFISTAIDDGELRLLGVKGVDRVRRKNPDAEDPNQYCYKLNHDTHLTPADIY